MIDFQDRIKDHRYVGTKADSEVRERAVSSIFKLVYGWMFLGLALSGGVAWMFFKTEAYKSVSFGLLITHTSVLRDRCGNDLQAPSRCILIL